MNIVILGAGQVGKTLAENLSGEKHDICVVDSDASKLREIKERLMSQLSLDTQATQLYYVRNGKC